MSLLHLSSLWCSLRRPSSVTRSVVTRSDELNNDDGWVDGWMDGWKIPRALDKRGGPQGTSLLYLSTSQLFCQTFQNNVTITTLLWMDMVLFSLNVVANTKERKKETTRKTETPGWTEQWWMHRWRKTWRAMHERPLYISRLDSSGLPCTRNLPLSFTEF